MAKAEAQKLFAQRVVHMGLKGPDGQDPAARQKALLVHSLSLTSLNKLSSVSSTSSLANLTKSVSTTRSRTPPPRPPAPFPVANSTHRSQPQNEQQKQAPPRPAPPKPCGPPVPLAFRRRSSWSAGCGVGFSPGREASKDLLILACYNAVATGQLGLLKALQKTGKVPQVDKLGNTPLHVAARCGQLRCLR